MNPNQVLDIVTKINEELYDEDIDDSLTALLSLYFTADGYHCKVEFLGWRIWSTDDDCRKFDDAENEYESLEDFLRREKHKLITSFFKYRGQK